MIDPPLGGDWKGSRDFRVACRSCFLDRRLSCTAILLTKSLRRQMDSTTFLLGENIFSLTVSEGQPSGLHLRYFAIDVALKTRYGDSMLYECTVNMVLRYWRTCLSRCNLVESQVPRACLLVLSLELFLLQTPNTCPGGQAMHEKKNKAKQPSISHRRMALSWDSGTNKADAFARPAYQKKHPWSVKILAKITWELSLPGKRTQVGQRSRMTLTIRP